MELDQEQIAEALLASLPIRLLEMLRERDISDEEIFSALQEGTLHLLAVDQMLGPPRKRLTIAELSAETGVDPTTVRRLWRALGFQDVTDEDRIFSSIDVEAVTSLKGLMRTRATDVDVAIQLARVIGSSMARIAAAEIVASNSLKGVGLGSNDFTTVDLADRND